MTLRRYYHGPARLVGVPPVGLAYQRYDEQLAYVGNPHALDPLEAELTATLRAGHRVWLLGDPLTVGTNGPVVPPALRDWLGPASVAVWEQTIDAFLVQHAAALAAYDPAADLGQPVSRYERPLLYKGHGWRAVPPAAAGLR